MNNEVEMEPIEPQHLQESRQELRDAIEDLHDTVEAAYREHQEDIGQTDAAPNDIENIGEEENEEEAVPPTANIEGVAGESIIDEAVDKLVEENKKKEESINEVSENLQLEILDAIKECKVSSYEDGYYNKPALKTKYGLVVPEACAARNDNGILSLDAEWTKVFLRFFYSRTYNVNFLQAMADPDCFKKCENAINKSIEHSSFFEEEDPFSIKLPFSSMSIGETSTLYLIPSDEYKNHAAFGIEAFKSVCELSKRNMESEVDLFYYTEILPKVSFHFEEVAIPENDRIKSTLRKSLKVRKIAATTGSEFFTITGPRRRVAEVAAAFKDVLSDNSIKFQQTYRSIAKEFLANNWWHPDMGLISSSDIPNPEKIFTPNLSKRLDRESYEKAMKEIYRIRLELIPEGSVLALVSPFVFERPVKEYDKEQPALINAPMSLPARDENDMTYLPDFMTEKFLVSNMSLNSMNATIVNSHGLPDQDITTILSCGLLTDDKLNSSRKILDLPELPANATIILKSLEFR